MSVIEVKGGLMGSGMHSIIMSKFCQWDPIYPIFLMSRCEESEVLFYFLIDLFCLTISLEVVCSGWGEIDPESGQEFFGKLGHKCGSSIRDDILW